jgi:hypothetical protein
LTIHGNYEQELSGTLRIDIEGLADDEFDRLIVQGHATLDGTVDLALSGGYKPQMNDSFLFLETLDQPDGMLRLASDDVGKWFLDVLPNGVAATYVPEPSSLLVLTIGAFALFAHAWRGRPGG